jgi:3-phenylpropionate/cinnamic acid dioxygenase small subunit
MAGEIALERIVALQAAYIRCIDAHELEAWPEFFSDACLYKVTTAENYKQGFASGAIYADSKAMLTDRITALREANVYEKHSYRHILGLPNVLKNGGGQAECETPFLVARIMHDGQSSIFATGVYLDTICDDAGALKFAQRVVVCDSSRIDTLIALPL